MNMIFRLIRQEMNITQQQFAERLEVGTAAVNRWENGKAVPENTTQEQIFKLALASEVEIPSLTEARIEAELNELPRKALTGYFFHASRNGIHGPIAPISRADCDFGRGFYMGVDVLQPLTLVCDNDDMKFYIVGLNFAKAQMLVLEPGLDWAMTVAYCRGKLKSVRRTAFYSKYENMFREKNIVIGSIADDRMFYVLKEFFNGSLTDEALVASLTALDLGMQCVAITQDACDAVTIEKEIELSHVERLALRKLSKENRERGIALADAICLEHRREGRYFDEILKEAADDKR